MIIDFNYSTNPFRDTKKYVLGAILLSGIIIVLAIINSALYSDFLQKKEELLPEINFLESKKGSLNSELAKINKKSLESSYIEQKEEIDLLNHIIDVHTFSWTKLLDQLERVTPQRMMVTSIKPEIEKSEFTIRMTVKTESYAELIKLIDAMNKEKQFADLLPLSETSSTKGGQTTITADLYLKYIPLLEEKNND